MPTSLCLCSIDVGIGHGFVRNHDRSLLGPLINRIGGVSVLSFECFIVLSKLVSSVSVSDSVYVRLALFAPWSALL